MSASTHVVIMYRFINIIVFYSIFCLIAVPTCCFGALKPGISLTARDANVICFNDFDIALRVSNVDFSRIGPLQSRHWFLDRV
jgi:hypothetical protein